MKKNPTIAGLIAGGVAAVLYLSLATGSGIGLLLFYLAPLPGFIAGFGWGLRAGIVAAIAGSLAILAGLGPTPAIAYAASLALPSIIIIHYAFLYRAAPSTPEDEAPPEDEANGNLDPAIEWYPVGNLVLIVALYGGFLSLATILLLGPSHEAYLHKTGSELDLMMATASKAGFFKKLNPEDLARYKKLIQDILPASTAVLWSLFALVNMWIAAHIVRVSDLFQRPWPDLSLIHYPAKLSLVFVALLVLSIMIPGLGGLVLSGFVGGLMMAYLLLGLAVVHHVTRPFPSRGLILFATYVAVILIGWGAMILIIIGSIEPFTQFRQRIKSSPS